MFEWMRDDLEARKSAGLYRTRRRPQSAQSARLRLGHRDYWNFTSNDYLGYAADPRVAGASSRAARRYGAGAGASPLITGWSPPLRALERELARWEATEAALVFASGYAANVAVVSSLAGADDVVFSDELNHASLIDGCRLARARVRIYRHADCNHLEELLQTDRGTSRRRWIVSDSLFSMDGDAAPLADLLDLAERHDAGLILDEAHATGVLGPLGRGLTDLLPPGRDTARLIKIGTLSKALGSQGGFVCGTRELIDWLVNHARPYIFSTALAPPAAAAALRSIRLVQTEPHRRRDLLASADRLREGLRALGLDVGRSTTQIVPILVGPPEPTLALSQRLQEAGMLVPAIRPPSVPPGSSRLRLSLTAGHGEAIEPLLQAIARQL